ncbi:MAG TPA: class I lanthipeptide [Thermoanaerobaculia bacterium]|jgi:hypothetical protein|nr:class I lanthipeptide [Thermoanaerobaculia bacterium]
MKKPVRRLTLNRETLRRLDETTLRQAQGGAVVVVQETQEVACYSPLCGPTGWKTCDANQTVAQV